MKKSTRLIILGSLVTGLAVIVFILGTVVTFSMRKIYDAHAMVQAIFPEDSRIKYTAQSLELLTQTQVQLVLSKPVLQETARKKGLVKKWSMAGPENAAVNRCCQVLKERCRAVPVPKSVGLISIRVFSTNPTEAADIANALAVTYRDFATSQPQQGGTCRVTVINYAEPALAPCKPNVPFCILISSVVSLLILIVGLLLLFRGYRSRPRNQGDLPRSTRTATREVPVNFDPR
ncbi:MAG: hypothetical protein HZA88_19575 [Verrucomicrobia bacterium]|nr:hypothetical protein [Verrucomicrobiota bacterium]